MITKKKKIYTKYVTKNMGPNSIYYETNPN